MARRHYVVVLTAVLTVGAMLAWAGEAGAPVPTKIRVPVRRYKTLSSSDVYRAAVEGVRAYVRFQDAYTGPASVPGSLRRIDVEGVTYQPVVAFRTAGDLVCLVAASNADTLRSLLAIPPEWPLTPAALSRPIALNRQQQVTIEGTVIGATAGEKWILADAVLVGGEQRAPTQRELHLFWDGQTQPTVMSAPGTETLALPCSFVAGQNETFKVTVRALDAGGIMAEAARLAAQLEGAAAGVKAYGQYAAVDVYRKAGEGTVVNVDFADTVRRVAPGVLPGVLSTVTVLRGGVPVEVPVAAAFETGNGVTCLVPAGSPTLAGMVSRALSGETVRVRGTVIGTRGAYNCVAVDYIGFPAEETPGEMDWWVTVDYPNTPPRAFWGYGFYSIPDLPCQYAPGRAETLKLLISEFREIEVLMPAPVPALPAPAPAAG